MNIMRKLWVGGNGSSGSPPSSQSISLGLMHLRKLFGDYLHSPSDDKVYNMLPLFCKVFGTSSATDMIERFPEINSFCQVVSKLLVAEIRKRASNQCTETASVSIIRFFEAASESEEDSKGWSLLTTLNLLSAGDQNLVDVMSGAAVPSTLVKCLYLFFDLPPLLPPENRGPTSDFSPMERRLLVQKVFVQLLIRLSSHPTPAEELAKKDDLALLFSAVTSWCPPHNAMWRKSSAEVLMTISTHGLTPQVLSYIHNKACVALCVENLRRGSHLTPLEITEMVLTLFCFLKDSSELSPILLDDFKSAQGYQFFTEILLRLEVDLTSECQEAIRNLILVVGSLTMCGNSILKPNMANVESLFSLPTFQLPPPGARGTTVRNLQSFQVLQNVFNKSNTSFLSGAVLDSILSIFKADLCNYFIVDSVLPQMAEKLIHKSTEVQQKFLEIVEFVVFQLQFTPCKELIAISRILRNDLTESNQNAIESDNNRSTSAVGGGNGSNRASISSAISILTANDIKEEAQLKLICVRMLLNLAKHNVLFKDVFREIGILEVIITCLHRFGSENGKERKNDTNAEFKDELGLSAMELLTIVLNGSTQNVNIFRENNGCKCVLQLITESALHRSQALNLVQQLLMSPGGEEEMASILVALHSADQHTNMTIKVEILGCLLACFRESHRARCNFRKAGGFLYLMSVLVSMEGLLKKQEITTFVLRDRLLLVQLIFNSFALAMRFEPANAKLFHQEICLPSLADTLRLLGCFSRDSRSVLSNNHRLSDLQNPITEENIQLFHTIFTSSPNNLDPFSYQEKVPFSLVISVFVFRLMYDLAIDACERNISTTLGSSTPFHSYTKKQLSSEEGLGNTASGKTSETSSPTATPNLAMKKVAALNLTPPNPELIVVHSAVVIVMIKLLPAINIEGDYGKSNNLTQDVKESLLSACQLYCAEIIKSLVRSERNQQLMGQCGLIEEILERYQVALQDEHHYLHAPIHYIFERVSAHYLTPKDLRRFLRLGNPLNCERTFPPSANISSCYTPVPLSRVKSLVSTTTPRSFSHSSSVHQSQTFSTGSRPAPAFVEFDMSAEGFGCLFLPSLAPHNLPVGTDLGNALLTSGIGMGERVFPGTTGMCFSTWFCVDKFSDPRVDPHPIRILTIIKESGGNQRLCLSIVISARDKALIVSTRESNLPPQGIGEWEPDVCPNSAIRVWCPELLHEGHWNHLFFVFSTSTAQPFALYVNGRSAHVGKLEYPHRTKGATFSAFIGTPPVWRKASRLTYRQGIAHLFEDWVPTPQTVIAIHKLGPEYPGSWQSVKMQSDITGVLVAEDKILFGFNALAVSQLTLAKIRKIYSKSDAKAIAKQLGLSSHENATPISILHNSAAHLIGPARTLGGVTIGYLGVRIYAPLPVSRSLLSVGGIQVLIGLVAMATTSEALYASLKAVSCVIRNTCTNGTSSTVLIDRASWQMLGYLLKIKKNLLSMRVLHLVFGLVSTENSAFSQTAHLKENNIGFIELLGDLDIWCPSLIPNTRGKLSSMDSSTSTPSEDLKKQGSSEEVTPSGMLIPQKFDFIQNNADLEKALYEHFLQMLNDDSKITLELLREANIVPKLLRRLSQSTPNTGPLFLLLSHLLAHKGNASAIDLIVFGHYIVGTLPAADFHEAYLTDMIELRNKGLQLIHSLTYTGKVINVGFCEELVARLGFDFVLSFATPNLHPSTVLWSLRILLLLITSSPNLKTKFREAAQFVFGKTVQAAVAAHQSGGGTRNVAAFLPLRKQDTKDEDSAGTPVSVGPTVTAIAGGLAGVKSNKGVVSGWARLTWLLVQRCENIKAYGTDIFPPEIWLVICAMVLNQPCRNVSLKTGDTDQVITLDSIWNYVFALPASKMTSSLYGKVVLCPDAIIALLSITRCYIVAESASPKNDKMSTKSPQSPTSPNFPRDIGSCILQFVGFLYSNTPEFQSLFCAPEILSALASVYIPVDVKSGIAEVENLLEANENEFVKVVAEISDQKEILEFASEAESINTRNSLSEITPHSPRSPGLETTTSNALNQTLLQEHIDNFINHPAKIIVLDFLRMIIADSVFHPQSQSKGVTTNAVVDIILEAGCAEYLLSLEGNSQGAQYAKVLAKFHTNLLGTLLDHLIAYDLDRMTNHLQAVAQLLSRIVDKLWLESFVRDPQVILDFLLVLVNHCRSKRIPPTTTDSIYNSLNRVVLFVLSRRGNRWSKVEALKKIRGIRTVIFGSGNHQQEFFGCLVHVLMQLVDGHAISLEGGTKTLWHVPVVDSKEIDEATESEVDRKKGREAVILDSEISTTAEKVWEDLFISKKPMVEDLFKITFASPEPPPLSSLRDKIGHLTNKLWLTYVATETSMTAKKSANQAGISQSWEIHQQIQSKFQKVTGGLTRLAGRSGIRKDSEKEKVIKDLITQCREAKKVQAVLQKQLQLVKEVLEAQEKFDRENLKHLERYVRDTLLPQLESELTRERGIWGPTQPSRLDKWMLDTTEGPCRMRKKLIKNDMFYAHYPYAEPPTGNSGSSSSAVSSPKIKRINPPVSRDSQEFHRKFRHQQSILAELMAGQAGVTTSSLDEADDSVLTGGNTISTSSDPTLSPKTTVQSAADDPFSEGCMDTSSDPDNQSLLFRLIGSQNEKISQIFRTAQIQGLDTAEGLLLFGKEHFYLVSGFTILTKTREIKDMYYLPANIYEPILPPQCYGSGPTPAKPRSKTHTCWKFSYEDIREVHKRRYLLQPIALEIFCSDGRNYLLAYPRKVRNVVFQKFTSVSKKLSDSGQDVKQSVAGQRRSTSIEQSSGLFSSLMGDTTVTQRWVKGEISNFQYLMHLNTLAGRSYNDLMQYPVFPWILADYDSPYLDLNDPETFRDLSKPMGAQSSGRLVQFIKRYREWDDPHGETPPYHYGTHYSSAMIVCSYLVRMEPFAQHFLRLQGGHFDLADRMFHSIKEAWTSASKHNMADVKELIPEFFYLPEFLKNSNSFDLGCKQNGIALGDVLLPPWAKNDPREFIRMHREALESDYVSQHLNEWIDLIFGCKQQGPMAVEAVNVFHHLFYEGNVDIYNIDDPLKKNATIGFINNFGQIPKQLFKKLHPVKKASSGGQGLSMNLNILDTVNPLLALAASVSGQSDDGSEKVFFHHVENLRPTLNPLKELKGPVGQIIPSDKPNSIISVEQNKFLLSSQRYISWGFADCSIRICNTETDRPIFIWEYQQQQIWSGSIGEVVSCCGSEKTVVTGSTNTIVSVWDVAEKELRLKAHLYGHSEPVTCLACSPSFNIIVSGSKDMTCILWDLARLTFVRQLVPHYAAIDAVGINELTGDIATCDGSWLRLWSVNGDPICQVDTAGVGGGGGMSQGILCVSFSCLNEWDPDNVLITGSTDGIVRMWSLRFLQIPKGSIGRDTLGKSNDEDSSITTASDSEGQLGDEIAQPELELDPECAFGPEKDLDSLENLKGVPSVAVNQHKSVRRQRALSSGMSSRHDSELTENNTDARDNKTNTIKEIEASTETQFDSKIEINDAKDTNPPTKLRTSKSETSLHCDYDETFEILTDADVAALRKEEKERKLSRGSALLAAHQLREGHVWQRKLVFRGKLTMHTAYDRKDNTEPASITAVAVSRDHKNIFVGDARGRVFSWAVSESASGRADHWVRDEISDTCGACQAKFSFSNSKHHCRNCGGIFCSKCSRFESEIFRLRILRPVRVCQPCYLQLKGRLASVSSDS